MQHRVSQNTEDIHVQYSVYPYGYSVGCVIMWRKIDVQIVLLNFVEKQ
jgi:hypothetical protein